MPINDRDYQVSPEQAKAIKEAYDKATKEGNPLAALAKAIAEQLTIESLAGQPLNTTIVDEAIQATYGVTIPRDATFVVDPHGKPRNLAMVETPPAIFRGMEIKPASQTRADVTAHELVCPVCKSVSDKEGVELEPQEGEPTHVVHCSNCSHYLWVVGEERNTDEN
jgi:hypothetical protein